MLFDRSGHEAVSGGVGGSKDFLDVGLQLTGLEQTGEVGGGELAWITAAALDATLLQEYLLALCVGRLN